MIVRKILTLLALTTLAIANQTIAQSYDSNPSAQKMHYYDIADFEMQASDINYADHIAPICSEAVCSVIDLAAAGQCLSYRMMRSGHGLQ